MRQGIKRALCLLSAASLAALCGCSAGDGNVYKRNTIQTVHEASRAEYRMASVKRGDITQTETVRLEYFAAREEELGFSTSGLYYDQINVSVGDTVKVGDRLASLECTEIDADIAAFTAEKANLQTEIDRNQELLDLLAERGVDEPEARREYEVAIRNAMDECAVADAELARLEGLRAGRIITSPIDGVISFAREVAPGDTSVNGRIVITVTDLDSCAFYATVQNPEAVDPEAIYAITISGEQYEIMLSSPEELGIEAVELNEKSTRFPLYFRLLTPSVNLSTGDTSKFSVVVDSRSDVLYIPATALTEVDGVPSVYVPDENGLSTVRNVEIGLNTGKYVEITGGLQEGDSVILY